MKILYFVVTFICYFIIVNGQISFGSGGSDDGRSINQPSIGVNQPQNFQNDGQNFDIVFENTQSDGFPSCSTPDQKPGFCQPLAACALFYAEIPKLLENPCQTRDGNEGVCCPQISNVQKQFVGPRQPGLGSDGVLSPPATPRVAIPSISPQQVQESVNSGIRNFQQRQQNANTIVFQDRVTIPKGSPAEEHQKLLSTSNENLNNGENAQINLEVTKNIVDSLKLSKEQSVFGLPKSLISPKQTQLGNTCPPESQCNFNFPYRTIDGSCNNQKNLDWGKAGKQYQRILQPNYGDGVNSPRVSQNGRQLPSARLISARGVLDVDRPYNNFTLMLMQWGQFIDHDLAHTPIVQGANRTGISCCSNGQHLSPNQRHPDCFQIDIPGDDRFYSRFRQRCMEFVRSLPATRRGCNFGPREQMNQITGFIDGSMIYGSNGERARSLREFSGGRLIVQRNNLGGGDMLPANPSECSSRTQAQMACFRAGDLRTNEQINLAVLHTIFMREHNRVARELQRLNPRWSDEIIYQEARKIVGAEIQHITYNEFLPLILGGTYMKTYQLSPSSSKVKTRLYNQDIDPTITNAFAGAAFRFGHTLVPGILQSRNQFNGIVDSLELQKTQFKPFKIYESFDPFVRGLVLQPSQQFDSFVTNALTNHLFEGSSNFGLDLISLNIQRGRDHGLPGYLKWREICGLKSVTGWHDLGNAIDPQNIRTLQSLYESVEDIDLFIGGIMEQPLQGALLGPTFICIVGDQFARLRRGDRFYYEEETARFTDGQLEEIKSVNLARILCDNSNQISHIQPLVFQQASFSNRQVDCKSNKIPRINFAKYWKSSRRN